MNIAYILGIYLTDGYIKDEVYRGRSMSMRLRVVDKDIAENLQNAALNLLGKEYKIKKVIPKEKNCQPFYEINIYSNMLCRWLRNVTGRSKDFMPNFVYTESQEWKREFLAGLIDGDGWVSVSLVRNKKNPTRKDSWWATIGLCGAPTTYFKDIEKFFAHMGVDYSYTSCETKTVDEVRIKTSSFIENDLYFRCERKQKKVEIIKRESIGQKYNTQPLTLISS